MKLIATSTTDETSISTQAGAISVGISSCLLGNEVRYNGGHSHSKLCTRLLAEHFNFRSFCPEVATGLGVPRPTLRLVGDPNAPRLVFSNDQQQEVTERFQQAVTPVMDSLAQLDGYILMKNSPSCGLERVKVYQANGHPHPQRSMGLFTQTLKARYPDLPVEEEGRLNDDRLRENFILRVYAHHHFRVLVDGNLSLGRLMAFHRDYKYVLMAHSQTEYRSLGRLLAEAEPGQIATLRDQYHQRFMQAIAKPASRRNHCNVLLHIFGYLKRSVQQQARRQILTLIERYRDGEVNLATPLAMLEHYVNLHGSDYIRGQRYLKPYPAQLGLANRL
ncbi:YbgA family protein [Motiliproteus sp.]|uniref:YbgA family protein n=1 Tax=Motiliproteus sp. TaxID=1898955 RepID=UPI003BABCB01